MSRRKSILHFVASLGACGGGFFIGVGYWVNGYPLNGHPCWAIFWVFCCFCALWVINDAETINRKTP